MKLNTSERAIIRELEDHIADLTFVDISDRVKLVQNFDHTRFQAAVIKYLVSELKQRSPTTSHQTIQEIQAKLEQSYTVGFADEVLRREGEMNYVLRGSDLTDVRQYARTNEELASALRVFIVEPRVIYRDRHLAVLHFPYLGQATFRTEGEITCVFKRYTHRHFHLRNFNQRDNVDPVLHKLENSSGAISPSTVVQRGWNLAQECGEMITVSHQEGGDPEFASFTSYGPFYPLDFLYEEKGGSYKFDYVFKFVAMVS